MSFGRLGEIERLAGNLKGARAQFVRSLELDEPLIVGQTVRVPVMEATPGIRRTGRRLTYCRSRWRSGRSNSRAVM